MHVCRTLTLGILHKDFGDIIYFGEAGTPALLCLLCSLGAASVPPHELIIIEGSVCRALGIAPPADILLNCMPDKQYVCTDACELCAFVSMGQSAYLQQCHYDCRNQHALIASSCKDQYYSTIQTSRTTSAEAFVDEMTSLENHMPTTAGLASCTKLKASLPSQQHSTDKTCLLQAELRKHLTRAFAPFVVKIAQPDKSVSKRVNDIQARPSCR